MFTRLKKWFARNQQFAQVEDYRSGFYDAIENEIESNIDLRYDYGQGEIIGYDQGVQDVANLLEYRVKAKDRLLLLSRAAKALGDATLNTSEQQYRLSMRDAPCHNHAAYGMDECSNCQRELKAIRMREELIKYLQKEQTITR